MDPVTRGLVATGALLSRLVAVVALAGIAAGCGADATTNTASPPVIRRDASRVPQFSKVAVLFLENRGYREVIGNRHAPFLNRIARRGSLATRYYAVAHPSLPNYLAVTTGSTHGITRDCNACDVSVPSLASQLEAARIPWRAYFEGIPSPGFPGRAAGDYSKHYNPFAYSEQIGEGAVARSHVLGFGALRRALRAGALPRFSWITPNLVHDGHNGSVRASDRFLARLEPRVVRSLGPHGVLFVGWDEAHGRTGPRGGHVALIATGPGARRGSRVPVRADHYSLLATLEAGLRLPALGRAGRPSTHLLAGLLKPAGRVQAPVRRSSQPSASGQRFLIIGSSTTHSVRP